MSILRRLLPILAALFYVVSPVDALPDLLPGLGWVDDILVVVALLWYLSSQQGRSFPWDVFRGRVGDRRGRSSDGPRPEDFRADFDRMDPYALLEVPPQASPEEIKTAYKRAVGRYHPDKVAHLGKEFQELAHKKLLAIQKAYDLLQGRSR
ncbi:MAG: DnaJ domain-containing protein [candidate division NC10 bacterium]|nr:DnaJ domain-containing protein [candidate division NC10 bacterium]